jgi:hypothetical protein
MTRVALSSAFILAGVAGQALAQPFVAPGDIVTGWSQFSQTPTVEFDRTIELYDSNGVLKPDSWNQFLGIQSVEWDNTGGIPHNPMGHLIGVDFGATATGFRIYMYDSGTGWTGTPLFNDTAATAPSWGTYGLTTSRGGGVSVSPDNTKIALTGSDLGQVFVFGYDAANRVLTSGAATMGLPTPLVSGDTSGTAWLNNTTVIALSSSGQLVTVDASSMAITAQIVLPGAALTGSEFTALSYRPDIAPYIYASYSTFVNNATTNNIYVVDPRTSPWTITAGPISMSTSSNTMREIALGNDGALFWTTHGNSTLGFSRIHKLAGATNPGSIQPNSSVPIGQTTFTSSFNGMDVAGGTVTPPSCYANCDNSTATPVLNVADFTCFLQRYAAGESYANCDNSTATPVLNVGDFTCFLQRYAAGDP